MFRPLDNPLNERLAQTVEASYMAGEKQFEAYLAEIFALIENGADISEIGYIDYKLLIAEILIRIKNAKRKHKILSALFAAQTDEDFKKLAMQNALYISCIKRDLATVEFLVKNGADVNERICNNGAAIHAASAVGHIETIETLVKNGANVNAKNSCGNTALHIAIYNYKFDAAVTLLNLGAKANVKGENETPAQAYRKSISEVCFPEEIRNAQLEKLLNVE